MRPLQFGCLILIALLATGCNAPVLSTLSPTPTQDKLIVGYIALNATQLPAWVAKDQGIFDANELDVELQYLPTSADPTAAMLAGQVQVGMRART